MIFVYLSLQTNIQTKTVIITCYNRQCRRAK